MFRLCCGLTEQKKGVLEYPSPGNSTCPRGGRSPPPLPMHHTLTPPLAAAIVFQHRSCHLLDLLLWYLLKISKRTEPSMRHLKTEKHWFYVSMLHNPTPPPPFDMPFILALPIAPCVWPSSPLCAGIHSCKRQRVKQALGGTWMVDMVATRTMRGVRKSKALNTGNQVKGMAVQGVCACVCVCVLANHCSY